MRTNRIVFKKTQLTFPMLKIAFVVYLPFLNRLCHNSGTAVRDLFISIQARELISGSAIFALHQPNIAFIKG